MEPSDLAENPIDIPSENDSIESDGSGLTGKGQEKLGEMGEDQKALSQAGQLAQRLAGATSEVSRGKRPEPADFKRVAGVAQKQGLNTKTPKGIPNFQRSEHDVWRSKGTVIKATKLGEAGKLWGGKLASPRQYLERIELYNKVFRLPWDVTGVTQEGKDWRIVSEQPDYRGEPPTNKELSDLMETEGFEFYRHRRGDFWYREDDNVMVYDLEPNNAMKVGEDSILIDVVLEKPSEKILKEADITKKRRGPVAPSEAESPQAHAQSEPVKDNEPQSDENIKATKPKKVDSLGKKETECRRIRPNRCRLRANRAHPLRRLQIANHKKAKNSRKNQVTLRL